MLHKERVIIDRHATFAGSHCQSTPTINARTETISCRSTILLQHREHMPLQYDAQRHTASSLWGWCNTQTSVCAVAYQHAAARDAVHDVGHQRPAHSMPYNPISTTRGRIPDVLRRRTRVRRIKWAQDSNASPSHWSHCQSHATNQGISHVYVLHANASSASNLSALNSHRTRSASHPHTHIPQTKTMQNINTSKTTAHTAPLTCMRPRAIAYYHALY